MARRSVKWAEVAWDDLDQIADFVARDSEYYAAAFVRRIRDTARSMDVFSERGRVVPELGDPNVREIIVGNYRLIHEVTPETIFILGVIHGARDLAALWEREKRGNTTSAFSIDGDP